MFESSAFLFLLIISVASCQFFYNYEEDRPETVEPDTQNYDQSAYQYNPPSAVNQQYLQSPSSESQPVNERGNRRTRIRVRSRNYQSEEPNYNEPQSAPVVDDIDQRAMRQERRQERRRQRQNDYMIQPVSLPRMLGPSIFENIGLGEAPSGVYIPSNSFLNVLRNQRAITPHVTSQPITTVPQTTNYIQSSVDNSNRPRFFVQPPSNDNPRQSNLILPVTRPVVEYVNAPVPQTIVSPVTSSQARSVRGNRRSRPRIRMEPEHAAPPTVDIDALREYTDDVARKDVMPQVQYAPVTIRQNLGSQNRRRAVANYQGSTPAPRVYSPSIFEKVGLGEAPSGVYVPEDSLLNVLRNPSSHRIYRQESPPQPAYSSLNEHEEVVEEYQPPPPPLTTRRRSSQRSQQAQLTRRKYHNEENQNAYDEYQNVQPNQSSTQRRRENYEEFERKKPPVSHRTQSQRRPAVVSAPRPQPQSSTSETSQSTFRKAKLAIAELPHDTDEDGIPGEAGVNYPTLHVIPKTSFSCSQQTHNGYYADLETACQVVHLCQSGGVQNSFLCPNGTIFSQEKFSCQWWYKVDCSEAPRYYVKNDELYKVPEKKERKRN